MIDTHTKRHVLPTTRRSTTHKFAIAGHEGYLTIGLFDDGSPGEVFIKMSKEGSTLSGLIQGVCSAFSLALQDGLTSEDAVARFRGMRFDPMGPTSNPDIPEALSILDYVARYLDLHYVQNAAHNAEAR
jgi:ribonucleoside-diphosphate reductase alpha chain